VKPTRKRTPRRTLGRKEKRGRRFEDLIAWLHGALLEGAQVEPRARLPDRTNGTTREVDVLIRRKDGPFHVVTIVETRERKGKVDAPYIDELKARREALGANIIAAASTGGYTKGARAKAASYGIPLFTYEQAASGAWPEWLLPNSMAFRIVHAVALKISIDFAAIDGSQPGARDETVSESVPTMAAFAHRLLDLVAMDAAADLSPEELLAPVKFDFWFGAEPRLWLRLDDGTLHRMAAVEVIAQIRHELRDVALAPFRYSGVDGSLHTEVLAGSAEIDGHPLRIELAGTPAEGGRKISYRVTGAMNVAGTATAGSVERAQPMRARASRSRRAAARTGADHGPGDSFRYLRV
jgi:hypothetical protein